MSEVEGPDIVRGSRLLESLSESDQAALLPHMSRVALRRGEALFQPGEEVTAVHFPCGGTTIALVAVLPGAELAHAGVIGCAGQLARIPVRHHGRGPLLGLLGHRECHIGKPFRAQGDGKAIKM